MMSAYELFKLSMSQGEECCLCPREEGNERKRKKDEDNFTDE